MTRRQERILQETIQLISEGGIQGFTILRLASRIGVTEPAIYRHFKSKNEILQRILTLYTGFLQETIEKVSFSEQGSIDKISHILQEIVGYFLRNPRMISVIYAEEIFHF
jgi:TetR/AcrR family fatty acid metabolism transcriptional regulator